MFILAVISLSYLTSFLCAQREVVLQRTVVGAPVQLGGEVPGGVTTQSPLLSLLVCRSAQCQLCLGSCNQCGACKACNTICGSRNSGFCSRCSYCHGGTAECKRRCKRDKAEDVCGVCYTLCQVAFVRE